MRVALALLIILFAAGCREKTEQSAAPSAPDAVKVQASPDKSQNTLPETSSTREQVNSSVAATATPAAAPIATATDLAELTQALRKYSFEKQRVPKTFGEIVAAGYVKDLPPAPPGKKFAVDPKTVQVVLVKQ